MRCFDCLSEFAAGQERFAVLKKMRNMPEGTETAEARQLNGLLYDFVFICDECAGWYGDEAVAVPGTEAERD